MLILDSDQVKHCQVKGKIENQPKKVSGLVYNGKTFILSKSFPREELETAIKECREEYLDHEVRSQIPILLVKEETTVGIWMADSRYQPDTTSTIPTSAATETPVNTDLSRISVRQLALKMRESKSGLIIKTRRYKLKLYQRCFLGNEATDWIVEYAEVSRTDAIKLGQKMIDKKIFHHIVDEHQFKDEPLFYRFYEDEGKSIWTDKLV